MSPKRLSYEERANRAKAAFVQSLRKCKALTGPDGEFRQVTLAGYTGVNQSVISRIMSDPGIVSEKFIRNVVTTVPGMEHAYCEFRVAVDGNFMPPDIYDGAVQRVEQSHIIEQLWKDMETFIQQMKQDLTDALSERTPVDGNTNEPGEPDGPGCPRRDGSMS